MNRLPVPKLAALALGLAAAAAPIAANAGAGALLYERTLMTAAGERCRLFTPSIAAALAASGRQARGAAIREGLAPSILSDMEARARAKAAQIACNAPDLAVAAERVRAAFDGYSRMTAMNFPGAFSSWRADRGHPRQMTASWRLSQTAKSSAGPVVFGVAYEKAAPSLTAVVASPAALTAAGARLVLRDVSLTTAPYVDTRRKDLGGRVAPRASTRVFLASGRGAAPAGLLPAGAAAGAAFRFPEAAAKALEGLDPREAVTLELVYPTRDGERVESTLLEVGDFAAGRAFLAAQS
jgi:hypothetical protein